MMTEPSVQIPYAVCTCGQKFDRTQQVAGVGGKPGIQEGDISMCINCAKVWVFNADHTLHQMTADEAKTLTADELLSLAKMKAAIDATKKQPQPDNKV